MDPTLVFSRSFLLTCNNGLSDHRQYQRQEMVHPPLRPLNEASLASQRCKGTHNDASAKIYTPAGENELFVLQEQGEFAYEIRPETKPPFDQRCAGKGYGDWTMWLRCKMTNNVSQTDCGRR